MKKNRVEERRKRQMDILMSNKNITVGEITDLPIDENVLENIDEDSPYVEKVFDSGLSATVYKLKVANQFYTLKKVRTKILVENVDGQTSFLNEVQKRKILYKAKKENPKLYDGIVDTIYANFRKGIILSKWIEGNEITHYNYMIFDHLFKTMFAMMKAGIFENDPTTGNIICKDNRITLFDFGYAYEMNPLEDINMDGFDSPIFHPAERFEARAFMIHMFDVESIHGIAKACELYKVEKSVALKHYKNYANWLEEHKGKSEVISYYREIVLAWERALSTEDGIRELYELEKFKAFLADVLDDLSGQSCTPDTLLKVEYIIKCAEDNYSHLIACNALEFADLYKLEHESLIKKFEEYRNLSLRYQLKNLEGFDAWKKDRRRNVAKEYKDRLLVQK